MPLEERFYNIVDRWKAMYIFGGENVYPAEVKNVPHQVPLITAAAIITSMRIAPPILRSSNVCV